MLGMRYEEYASYKNGLPFDLQVGLVRTPYTCTHQQNWHEEVEVQLCTGGSGMLLVDGARFDFRPGDMAVVDSGAIHYTGTEEQIEYTCLIISATFCRQIGVDVGMLHFTPHLRDTLLQDELLALCATYKQNDPWRTVRLHAQLTTFLLHLAERYATPQNTPALSTERVGIVKDAIRYLREHYAEKVTLDDLALAVCGDKYALCRDFHRFTGQTIVTYLNHYRCMMAENALQQGSSVAEAGRSCGFESASFFCRTYKKYMGVLPSWVGREDFLKK